MDEISVLDLKLDYSLYPRVGPSDAHIIELAEALELGAKLPPVIAWRATKQVIDGFHRIGAAKRQRGENARVEVEWRDYANAAEAFEDAVKLNASHGLRLRHVDHEDALGKARALGMTDEVFSRAVKVPMLRLSKTRTDHARKPTPSTGWTTQPPVPDDDEYEPTRHREPRPLASQHPVIQRFPILVAAGQRMEDVSAPEHDFGEAVKAVVVAKHEDPSMMWDLLVDAGAAALKWAIEREQLSEAA